jgi:hypothetical protein
MIVELLGFSYQRALANIRHATERIWERPLHRYFTDHGITHSERICTLLDGLTAGMMHTDKRLVPTEAFVLLAAASLHDIGMQDERFAGGDLEEIRAHHHEQTAEMIYQVFEVPQHAFPIPLGDDPALVEAIALVAAGHRKVDLAGGEYDPLQLGDETLRLRLLAALLRFADELDIDHRRVDLEQMKLLNLPVESQLHWWRCHYVAGVSIVDEYIRVAYRFPKDRPDYEDLIIPLVENEIRAKHADLELIFRANAVKVAIGEPQVRLMRLVKPLPEAVEALAQEWIAGENEQLYDHRTSKAQAPDAQNDVTPTSSSVFDQSGQQVGTQINVAGNYHAPPAQSIHITGDGNVIGDHSSSHVVKGGPTDTAESGQPNVALLRRRLRRLDSVEIESLCLDHFPQVYDKFGRGLRRDEMINLLLDHCRRHPEDANRLNELLK